MGALWQQFGVRVDRLSHINVRSQTSKKMNDFRQLYTVLLLSFIIRGEAMLSYVH